MHFVPRLQATPSRPDCVGVRGTGDFARVHVLPLKVAIAARSDTVPTATHDVVEVQATEFSPAAARPGVVACCKVT